MRTLLPLVAALLVGGCTAAKASIQLVSAEQAMLRARSYGAEQGAEYEYTMAIRYLEKAREEAGYSEFRISDALARQSAEWSDRAIIFMERRGRSDINLDDFQNAPEPEAATVPPPVPPPGTDDAGMVPPPPPPEDGPTGNEGADELLQELFGEEGAAPAPAPDQPDKPDEEDFEVDDDIEIPK